MPIYEYECPECGKFEVMQKITADPLSTCETCGKPIQRLISATNFALKGTGWYATDYGKKDSAADKGKGDKAGKGGTGDKPEADKPTQKSAEGCGSGGGCAGCPVAEA